MCTRIRVMRVTRKCYQNKDAARKTPTMATTPQYILKHQQEKNEREYWKENLIQNTRVQKH